MSSERSAKGSNKKPKNNSAKKSDSGKKNQKIQTPPKVMVNSNKKIIQQQNQTSKLHESPTLTILKPKVTQITHSPTKIDIKPSPVKRELIFEKPTLGDFFKMISKDYEFNQNTNLFHENTNFHIIGKNFQIKKKN